MQLLLDHLSAVLIGGAVMLILIGVSLGSRQGAVEATQTDARFGATAMLAEMVEADFSNIGSGVPDEDPAILAAEGTAPTTAFEFAGAVDPSPTAPVTRVRYELHDAGTVVIGVATAAQTVPAYEVHRLVHDGTAFQLSGGSQAVVTEFSVRLLSAAGAPVGTDLEAARVAEVTIALTSPLGRGGSATVSRWQRRFQLTNLADG